MSSDVLLLVDHRAGAVEPTTEQLVAQARAIVAQAGGGCVAALLLGGEGDGLAEQLAGAAPDRILAVEHPLLADYNPEAWCRVAAEAVRRLEPALFLCAHTFGGMDVAPFVAAALPAPLLPNCLELAVEGGVLAAERLAHGGAWQTRLVLEWGGTVVASVARRGGGADSRGPAPGPPAEVERLAIDPGALGVRSDVLEIRRPAAADVDIARADVVVGVGRGIGDASHLPAVEALADALGGVVACSRPLVDLEWLPYDRQVGASGKAIQPKLYVACGISGAAQHLAGIADAQTVVAINRDPSAPIFRVAHYGVVGDLLELLPALTAEARRRRGAPAG